MTFFTTASRRARRKFIFSCLLVFVVIVATLTTVSESVAVWNGPEQESDSTLLAKHVKELKLEYALEEFSDHSFNAGYSDQAIDSILAEYRISFPSSKFVYSPDSIFKIAVVQGEGCGAYCNHFWETWFHFNDGSGMMLSKPGFENVTSIEKITDGKYLVWEYTYGRSGSVGYYSKTVTLMSIQGHKITYYPFANIPSQERMEISNNPLGSFSTYTSTNAEGEMYLTFSPDQQQLVYQYELDQYWKREDDSCLVYTGSFLYKNGLFEFQNETCKTRMPE